MNATPHNEVATSQFLESLIGGPEFVDSPFSEAKELIAGFWMIQVKSREEAIEWAKRVPFHADAKAGGEGEIELRQVFEMDDFGPSPAVQAMRNLGME